MAAATQHWFEPELSDPPVPEVSPSFAGEGEARAWFVRERANLLAALEAAHRFRLDALTCEFAATLGPIYIAASTVDDLRRAGELGLVSAERTDDSVAYANMLSVLAEADRASGDFESALARFRQVCALYQAAGDTERHLRTVNGIGLIHLERRELDHALSHFSDVLDLACANGMELWAAVARDNLAATHKEAGRLDPAAALAHQALDTYQNVGIDRWVLATPLLHLACIHRETAQFDLAEQFLARAEKALPNPDAYLTTACAILLERAALAEATGNHEQANNTYWQCVHIQRPLGHRAREATAYSGLGRVLTRLGQPEAASDFHRQALALRRLLPNRFLLATTLADLAETLDACGAGQDAEACRAEAYELLVDTMDPRAQRLRSDITALRTGPR